MIMDLSKAKESSISVAVRIRPLTSEESQYLQEDHSVENELSIIETEEYSNIYNKDYTGTFNGISHKTPHLKHPSSIRKILDVVDDRMLIFDPKPSHDNREVTERLGSRQRSFSGIGNHNKRHKEHKFVFDRLFDEESTQNEVYQNTAKPAIEAVLDGFNSTIFAYGATGCGKTFTITGTLDQPGIVFLALRELFMKIENQQEKDITVEVSYLEIYNESIKDLLNIETHSKKLTLLENENREIIVSNLTKMETINVEEVMDIIIQGNYNRTVSPTEANLTSSRSHAVLQVYITQNPRVSDIYEKTTKSVLSIIDLAGSERASATKNKGARLTEGANINKSLLALGNCINALCDVRRSTHVPYRDSKLTRLLKFSLGGNCKTVMIVCVSPSSKHYDETLNALKFANRAKEIKTKVMRNRTTVMKHVGSYMKIISDQKRRIHELETLMDSAVHREVTKYIDQRNNVQNQTKEMVERLRKNVEKCDYLKNEKVQIVVKRKMLLLHVKQINEFYKNLLIYDGDDRLLNLKNTLMGALNLLKEQIVSLEFSYNQRTELDTVLLETSESFLKKLRELEAWTIFDEESYIREVEFLKSNIERHVYYESSILFDTWISEEENIGSLDMISSILSQFLCEIEDVANNIQTVEQARMKCFQLSDDLVNNCIQRLNQGLSFCTDDKTLLNTKKRKSSGGSLNTNENPSETSLVRQGNRISSINNKLMRINLNSNNNKEPSFRVESNNSNKDKINDILSEVESSLILEQDVNQGGENELTPERSHMLDNLYESPNLMKTIEEAHYEDSDDANSSVIIRKEFSFKSGSPLQNKKIRGNRLTSKRLNASPKISSPHRLVGLDSNSNSFQVQLRESFGTIFTNPIKESDDNQLEIDVEIGNQ